MDVERDQLDELIDETWDLPTVLSNLKGGLQPNSSFEKRGGIRLQERVERGGSMRKRNITRGIIAVFLIMAGCAGGGGGGVPVVDGPSTIKITSPTMNEGTDYSEMDIQFDIALGKADNGSHAVIFVNGQKKGEAKNKKEEPMRYYPLRNLENGTYEVKVVMYNKEGKKIEGIEDTVTFKVAR